MVSAATYHAFIVTPTTGMHVVISLYKNASGDTSSFSNFDQRSLRPGAGTGEARIEPCLHELFQQAVLPLKGHGYHKAALPFISTPSGTLTWAGLFPPFPFLRES